MIYLVTRKQELFNSELYTIIDAEKSLNMMKDWDCVQLDSETTGRDPHICDFLCVQFGNDKTDIRIVLDCSSYSITLYKDILESKLLILQNAKFDLQFLFKYHIIPKKIYDTMIVEQLLYLGYPSGQISYGLKAIADRRLNVDIDKTVRGEIIWRGLDDSVIMYAAGDVTYLEKIMLSQIEDLKRQGLTKAAQLENRAVIAIAYIEWSGIYLDETLWKEKMKGDKESLEQSTTALNEFVEKKAGNDGYTVEEDFLIYCNTNVSGYVTEDVFDIPSDAKEIPNKQYIKKEDNKESVYTKIIRKYPFCTVNLQGDLFAGFDTKPKCNINWSSPQQVIKYAKFLGFDTSVKDKKTGEDKDSVLEKALAVQKGINDEFLKLYFKYREYAKVVSSFGQGHLNAINPITGRLHTVFKQLGAASGRLSCGSQTPNTDLAKLKGIQPKQCTYLNIQQLPADEKTRSAFKAPNDNYLFVSADFSAEESRLGADIYQDKAFLNEFLYGSKDTHNMFAWIVYRKECEELGCTCAADVKKLAPQWRKKVKGFEFGYMFGAAAPTLSKTAGCTVEEAQSVIDTLDKAFTGMTSFALKGSEFVKNNGYILINPITGHKMYWWDWKHWKEEEKRFNSPGFWDEYKLHHKGTGDAIAMEVRQHFQAGSKWSRMARNAVTQGTGSIIMKTALTNLFWWIVNNGYFDIVHVCASVHDEICADFPKEIKDFPKILEKIMEDAAAQYCKSLPIPAEAEVSDHWVH